MKMEYRIAATMLDRIRTDAADAVDIDDSDLDEYAGYIKVMDAVDRKTAEWLEEYEKKILVSAADRAEKTYRQRCGGCGEFEEQPCLQALAMSDEIMKASADNCSHVKRIRESIISVTDPCL